VKNTADGFTKRLYNQVDAAERAEEREADQMIKEDAPFVARGTFQSGGDEEDDKAPGEREAGQKQEMIERPALYCNAINPQGGIVKKDQLEKNDEYVHDNLQVAGIGLEKVPEIPEHQRQKSNGQHMLHSNPE
jgi:hypothetical protein